LDGAVTLGLTPQAKFLSPLRGSALIVFKKGSYAPC